MRLILILALLCLVSPHTHAADVFIKKKNESPTGEELEDALGLSEKKEPSTQPVSKDLANSYYKNCLRQEDATMSAESQNMLCACTAAKMTEIMTAEEIQTMFTDTPDGEYQRSRMTVFVYVPCMEYPTRDLVLQNCMANPEITTGIRNARQVCTCLADNIGAYVAENGARILASNPGNNPQGQIAQFLDSKAVELQSKKYIATCIQTHALGTGQSR